MRIKCKLGLSVCNPNQKWNHDKFRCEYMELDDWNSYEDDCMWNSNMYDCESNKTCKIDEYLHIKNCSCQKPLIDKIV